MKSYRTMKGALQAARKMPNASIVRVMGACDAVYIVAPFFHGPTVPSICVLRADGRSIASAELTQFVADHGEQA